MNACSVRRVHDVFIRLIRSVVHVLYLERILSINDFLKLFLFGKEVMDLSVLFHILAPLHSTRLWPTPFFDLGIDSVSITLERMLGGLN